MLALSDVLVLLSSAVFFLLALLTLRGLKLVLRHCTWAVMWDILEGCISSFFYGISSQHQTPARLLTSLSQIGCSLRL